MKKKKKNQLQTRSMSLEPGRYVTRQHSIEKIAPRDWLVIALVIKTLQPGLKTTLLYSNSLDADLAQ